VTEIEFLAELRNNLRVGPRARRRILLEFADHLANVTDGVSADRLGSPERLAADFNATYAAHRTRRLRTTGRVAALGLGTTLVGCALLLSGDIDGDRNLWPELLMVAVSTAAIALGLTIQRYRLLAACLGIVGAGWLAWSLRLVESGTGMTCLLLLVIGLVGAGASEGLTRSLRQPIS
jgi:uncharacterized membrane protein